MDEEPYNIFSNLYIGAPFVINDIVYSTPIHYYYWNKFTDPVIRQRILAAPTALMAKEIADKNNYLAIPQFDKMEDTIMLNALRGKFSQNASLASELKNTGTNPLIYHSVHNTHWSDGGDGSGYNTLGKLLMQVRTELASGTIRIIL